MGILEGIQARFETLGYNLKVFDLRDSDIIRYTEFANVSKDVELPKVEAELPKTEFTRPTIRECSCKEK